MRVKLVLLTAHRTNIGPEMTSEGPEKKSKLISFHWLDNISYFRFRQFIICWSMIWFLLISEVALFAKKHSQYAAAKIFNVARRRIFDWMRQIPKLEELIAKGHMKKMTGRGPKNRDIDQALYNWYCERSGRQRQQKSVKVFSSILLSRDSNRISEQTLIQLNISCIWGRGSTEILLLTLLLSQL